MIIHTLNRGVDKRKIFLDDQDYFRFVHNLYKFNDQDNANTNRYSFIKSHDIESPKFSYKTDLKQRRLLVDIYAFTLMPNHYHLMLSPLIENGIPIFMQKITMGYAKYFNARYERVGALFQGSYKSILIAEESHFIHLPYYIHCNPLDLAAPGWRKRNIANYADAIKFLEEYRWSSHRDYLGKKNFPSITHREFLLEYFDGTTAYRNNIEHWIKNMDLEHLGKTMLEAE